MVKHLFVDMQCMLGSDFQCHCPILATKCTLLLVISFYWLRGDCHEVPLGQTVYQVVGPQLWIPTLHNLPEHLIQLCVCSMVEISHPAV